MYKIIVDNVIVDVIKKLRYVRYIPELNRTVVTSPASAQAICGSDSKTFYTESEDLLPPNKSNWKVGTYIKISEAEYNFLSNTLKTVGKVQSDFELQSARKSKISELSDCCKKSIIDGFTCTLSDNKEHHFRLTLEDQLNLIDLEREITNGAKEVLFHSTDNMCKMFLSEDICTVLYHASKHKQKQTTYFNLLKYVINNMTDIESINKISYGVEVDSISEDLKLSDDLFRLL